MKRRRKSEIRDGQGAAEISGKSVAMKRATDLEKRIETSKNEIKTAFLKLQESAKSVEDFENHKNFEEQKKSDVDDALASCQRLLDNLKAEYEQYKHLNNAYKGAMNDWMKGK